MQMFIPLLRAAGMALLFVLVVAHHRVVDRRVARAAILSYGAFLVAYCLLSWIISRQVLSARPHVDRPRAGHARRRLRAVARSALHLTGGPQSWLFALLFVRVADQIHTSLRQTMAFGAISVAAYVSYLLWRQWQGLPVDWTIEPVKIAALVAVSVYLSLTAKTAEYIPRAHAARRPLRALADSSARSAIESSCARRTRKRKRRIA